MHIRLRLRWKFLLVLMVVGVLPLLISAWLDLRGMAALGLKLAEQSGQALSEQTHANLEQLADNYTTVVNRERQLIELLVQLQAKEAQSRLDAPPPNTRTFWSEDYDASDPDLDLVNAPGHYNRAVTGEPDSPGMSYDRQVFFAPQSVNRANVANDAARLTSMTPFYRDAYARLGDLVYRQYIALDNGLLASYPGHGGFPAAFDARARSWYRMQQEERRLRWSRPHVDATSLRALINATMPIIATDGRFLGVAGVDVGVEHLMRRSQLPAPLAGDAEILLTVTAPGETGDDIVVVARAGAAAPPTDWREQPDLARLTLAAAGDHAQLQQDMAARKPGYLRTVYDGRDVFCLYRPFGNDRSYLVFMVPAGTLTNPAVRAAEYALASTQRQMEKLLPLAGLIILVVLLVAFFGARTLTDPIDHLVDAATRIGAGDFDVRVRVNSGDELERLAGAFNRMVPQLEEHSRVREALGLASEIQRRLLPNEAPGIDGLDLAGFSIYSEQTGGDYYDFLDVGRSGKRQVAIAIGDVSGHGVASALLMATVRALLHGVVESELSPAEVLQHVNEKIAQDVYAGQFMTLFYLRMDIETRSVRWSSAGHDPAIRFNRTQNAFSLLEGQDIPVGVDAGWTYADTHETVLGTDDVVVIGTDGIWDTRNERGEFFGKARLRDLIRAHQAASAEALCDIIVKELQRFRGRAAQRDDVTAVVFRFTDPNEG